MTGAPLNPSAKGQGLGFINPAQRELIGRVKAALAERANAPTGAVLLFVFPLFQAPSQRRQRPNEGA